MSGSFSYTPQVQGWLLKQRHGICKSWLRRFFVLEGSELRYYKSETARSPHCVINLASYQVVTDVTPIALPLILKKQPQRQFTFLLISNDRHKSERSDLFLQAETKEELDIWVNALQMQQLNDSTSVLDKWLERLDDMHNNTPPQPPASSLLSPKQQRLHHHRPPLRGHRSSESLASSVSSTASHSTATTSHRSSFAELRRTSNPSTLSSATSSPGNNKFFASLFHHWPRSKSPARSVSPPPMGQSEEEEDQQQQQQQDTEHERAKEPVVIAPALPIIDPSEYKKVYRDEDKRQSLALRRNVQVAPITNPKRLSRGRSCSSLVVSDSSTDSIVDSFPRVLTTPTLGGPASS